MSTATLSDVRHQAITNPVRVMVVDDSVVARGLMTRWVDEDPELAVIASHRNGKLAVEDVARSKPDVIVLDIEMPDMDGLTALPLLLKALPKVQIVMASTLTRRNAEISLKALSLGAADYIPKPDGNSGMSTSADFRRELVEKVRQLGRRALRMRGFTASQPMTRTAATPATQPSFCETTTRPAASRSLASPAPAASQFSLRHYSASVPRILAIGSSTGGPQALAKAMTVIGPELSRVPCVITQHMPATFTAILAEHLAKTSGRPAAEGIDGELLQPGHIYVAPGGRHMVLEKTAAGVIIRLNDAPPVNFCKPAVDPLFDSVAAIYGSAVLSAVLTGMGSDGAKGAVTIANAGGSVIAQDEETSVVWGMPQAAAAAGACSAILPLDSLAATVARVLKGGRP